MLPRLEEMVPKGGIISFAGAVVDIPAGWQLCDGTNGTPDLRNEFVPGAGDTYAVDETGGVSEHEHFLQLNNHNHEPGDTHACNGTGLTGVWDSLDASAFAFKNGAADNKGVLPSFFALAYIQRMV